MRKLFNGVYEIPARKLSRRERKESQKKRNEIFTKIEKTINEHYKKNTSSASDNRTGERKESQ